MFNKILIANRGEIACRIIKTARKLGVKTLAIYSDADREALHTQMADEAVYVGEAPSRDSYLQGQRILDLAEQHAVDAIHPGYGFLSENADFARACEQRGVVFIGPPASAIEAMGSKSAAKSIMQEAGVPLVPGYHGDQQSAEFLQQQAEQMGYPVLLKAAAGGGGKGMRQVTESGEFTAALAAAKREAMASFNDDLMLVEKYLTEPRHVEIQVFCDSHGQGVYLFERDCSVQRRHQKIIEEAPAPGVSPLLRQQMGEAALKAAHAIDYQGAGTVEFLLDTDGQFYFMEMNTRLQVEHPVTEMISRQDLVEWQLRVAKGEPLPCTQQQLGIHGHAFEARIYAEDPDNDFLPATGQLNLLQPPLESEHVRVDTGVVQGDEVSVYYDPMIAKLIVWDENRERALARLTKALTEYHVEGVTTNIDFLYNLASHSAFGQAQLSTHFIEQHQQDLFGREQTQQPKLLPAAALYLMLAQQQSVPAHNQDPFSPWQQGNFWRANESHQVIMHLTNDKDVFKLRITPLATARSMAYKIEASGRQYHCSGELQGDRLIATIDGHRQEIVVANNPHSHTLFYQGNTFRFHEQLPDQGNQDDHHALSGLLAPMNGTLVTHCCEPGQAMKKGEALVVLEAMKMEHSISAPADGVVTEFYYQPGDMVDGGQAVLAFEENGNV